jgi:hypothetical protein
MRLAVERAGEFLVQTRQKVDMTKKQDKPGHHINDSKSDN